MYVPQRRPPTEEERAKAEARLWDYQKSWFPLVPGHGLNPLTKQELDAIKDACKYPFCYELQADNVVFCNNKHGSIAFIKNGYLPSFFVHD